MGPQGSRDRRECGSRLEASDGLPRALQPRGRELEPREECGASEESARRGCIQDNLEDLLPVRPPARAFFQFSSNLEVFFYINENKVLASRQGRGEGEAVGRNMVLTFFEVFEGHPGMVRRVDRRDGAMHPRQMTIAELLQVCGMNLPHDPERSSAEAEELLEEEFGRQELRRFSGHLETGSSELHVYMLAEEANAEEAFVRDMGLQNLTKIALARFLEKVGRGPRRAHWSRTLEDLQGEAGPLMAAEGIGQGEARAKAKGKAAVKAKAKGKAKGRGRGGRGGPP